MKVLHFLQEQIINSPPSPVRGAITGTLSPLIPGLSFEKKICFVTSRFSAWQTSGLLPQTNLLQTRMVRSFPQEPVRRSADFGSDENSSKFYRNIFS